MSTRPRPDADRLRRIEQLYHDTRERPAATRTAYLLETCPNDEELREEVASLLALDGTDSILEEPVLALAAPLLDEPLEPEMAPGSMAGPYEILEKIGAGGMGEVFQARDTRLGRTVALKTTIARFSGHAAVEARAIAALNHPNICTLYDVGPNYLVLEFVEGETLAERLRGGPLPPAEVTAYGAQIADALWSAHGKGITHGDLKPRNIMVTRSGVKILDFGLARIGTGGDLHGPAFGTPAYLSPEQVREQPIGARTDIYALGLILFEMATGRRPFSGESRTELSRAILHDPAPLERLQPPAFAHVVERCLAKEPDDRWQTARDVKLELEYAARLRPAPARRRRRWWVASAAALLVSAAAPVIYHRSRPPDIAVAPLTSYPGSETSPSFSPDGRQLAFSWDGAQEDNRDIYVKQVGPGDPVRLTTNPAEDMMPRWSPDGQWIAFLRREQKFGAGLYLIPALGGSERRLSAAALAAPLRGNCLDWTPDGQWLVVSALTPDRKVMALQLVSAESGEVHPLTHPRPGESDSVARFAPDGSAVAFVREGEGLMVLPLAPGWTAQEEPRQVRADVPGPIRSLAWSADSHDLLVASGFEESSWLWRVAAFGNADARRLPFGESASDADVARDGNRMAFSHFDRELNIWALDLDSAGRAEGPPVRAFDSTRSELSPAYSPDGRSVAFGSSRSGNDEIWVCRSDGSNCAQLTALQGKHAGSPEWSPDGKWIAFDVSYPNSWEVFVVQASGGKPRRLAAGMMPRWSHDSKSLYFRQFQSGATWKVPVAGGQPAEAGRGGMARESDDGRWLYTIDWAPGHSVYRLNRRLLSDPKGHEEVLPFTPGRYYLPRRDGIVYLSSGHEPRTTISFYDFATRTSRVIYQTERTADFGLTMAPDGRRLLFTQVDRRPNSDLMMAEHFR